MASCALPPAGKRSPRREQPRSTSSTGNGLLYGSAASPVALGTGPDKTVLDQAQFRGALNVGADGVRGSVRGTGLVTLSGDGKPVPADAALAITPAGTLSLSLPSGVLRPSLPGAGTTARSAASKSASADASGTYTLSQSAYDFLANTLHIPLGSATLSGTVSGSTLTVTAGAPTQLPSSLPSWIPNPSYASTQITVDESADTLTLTAATGTSSQLTATLTVTIDGADGSSPAISGSLALAGVPFTGGSTASLTFGLGYAGGSLTASLSGALTSPATFANGLVTIPAGASITLATGTGVTVKGTADITDGSGSAEIGIAGTLTDLSDWSLAVSDTGAAPWQPAAGLSITPDFTGSISDTAGAVGFDLTSAGPSPATWMSPDGESTVSVTSLEVSNQAPSSAATCASSQVSNGDLWIGVSGGFAYTPTNLQVGATGCFDLTAGSATIATVAAGNLTAEFGNSLPFSITAGGAHRVDHHQRQVLAVGERRRGDQLGR